MKLLLIAFLLLIPALNVSARTWTSADGKTLEGDYVSATDSAVTFKRKDGKVFTVDLAKLSQEDRDFVAEQKKAPAD